MVMGMSYAEYWDASPYLVISYRKAYRLKRKEENEKAWIMGAYVYDAVASVMANVFRKRGGKRANYIEKPFEIFPLTKREQEIKERMEMDRLGKQLESMVRSQQAKKKRKQGGE